MIFYVAHGAPDACGPGCSNWIAAEGAVQWDTYKRLLAILDRQNGRKLPVVINVKPGSDLTVAASLGRILRGRGIDAAVAATEVEACNGKPEEECFALKRPGGPLDAKEKLSGVPCELACVLMLAGGVHRNLPPARQPRHPDRKDADLRPARTQRLCRAPRKPYHNLHRSVPEISQRDGDRP
ncbi:hypothetical protein [Bradyrhizobium sp. USDA 4518]